MERDRGGIRCPATDRGAFQPGDRRYGQGGARGINAGAGGARAAAGIAIGGGEAVARSGVGCRCFRVSADTRDHGPRWGIGSSGRGSEGSGGAVVLFRRVVPDAVFGEAVPAVCAGKVSAPGEAVSTMVCKKWLRSGRGSAQSLGARGTDPREVWISIAAVGGKEALGAVRAVASELGCGGSGAASGTSAGPRDEIMRRCHPR